MSHVALLLEFLKKTLLDFRAKEKKLVLPTHNIKSVTTLINTNLRFEQARKIGFNHMRIRAAWSSVGAVYGYWTEYRHDDLLPLGKLGLLVFGFLRWGGDLQLLGSLRRQRIRFLF